MFDVPEVLLFAGIAGVLAAAVLAAWPWAHQRRRFLVAGLATAIGFATWNITLIVTDARGFNVDAPVIPFSLQDVGSGVVVFATVVAVLGLLTDTAEPARRVVGAAGIAAVSALLLDLFVL